MFRKFNPREDISGKSKVKSSVQRAIRSKILEQYPALNPYADELLPKKEPLILIKCHDRVNIVMQNDEVLFFNHHDGPYYPTLKLLHKYPDIMTKVQIDRGAIKFVLSGANIMCPGLTSKGGRLGDDLEVDAPVAVLAEGKEHALALGVMKMSSKEIKSVNKGHGIDLVHYLNDGLWKNRVEP
ncbi:PUA-like domain-containing protein [Fimicolochytrium jonesii]|uniref:PUA-like domain-containing protein n=1 Tax=Fimicolochytrium jonesii TaxID=1396493 RepID=UPI0022FEAB41|nr:PUA-like domain-containing protein [Fimicolochytrium jonesii]KAI8823452.1 PUA-like domain-containing protein [Fimicolochytrium jonesii]